MIAMCETGGATAWFTVIPYYTHDGDDDHDYDDDDDDIGDDDDDDDDDDRNVWNRWCNCMIHCNSLEVLSAFALILHPLTLFSPDDDDDHHQHLHHQSHHDQVCRLNSAV